jgi:hypothetical protein
LPHISSGYGVVSSHSGNSGVSGVAIFRERVGDNLVSEAGLPATPLVQSGRIYAEIDGAVNTGVAIANPYNSPAEISFFFTDANGTNSGAAVSAAEAMAEEALRHPQQQRRPRQHHRVSSTSGACPDQM